LQKMRLIPSTRSMDAKEDTPFHSHIR
jgi:hypothetical protein